jgi:ABC-type antimicrobial peptide transport system permease subunit
MRRDSLSVTMERLRGLRGIEAVGNVEAGSPPLVATGFRGGGASGTGLRSADAAVDSKPIVAEYRRVSSGFFDVIRNPVVRGRVFDESDVMRDTTIVIDERVAELLFGDRDAVGAEVVSAGQGIGRRTVIGVLRHVRLSGPELPSRPQVYLPATAGSGYTFLVRTSGERNAVISAIRAAFAPGQPAGAGAPIEIRSLDDAFRNITAGRRFNATLMSLFGVLAVVIGAAGVYGVMASVVAQQTRELGVRVALGATTGRIVGGVLSQAGRFLLAGLLIGLPAAWWASQSIAALLFEVRPTDVLPYAIVVGVMSATALVAAWIPARRAARVDPLVALRAE